MTCILSGCKPGEPSVLNPVPEQVLVSQETSTPTLVPPAPKDTLTQTLNSLQKVSNYPLYTMHYYGSYRTGTVVREVSINYERWGCSLFAALGDPQHSLYGRNFDWSYSPALLLFTHPTEGYESVSMVDLAYLFNVEDYDRLVELPDDQKLALLDSPYLPFDGMNEAGLVVAMAAVPAGNVPDDPGKASIDSLAIMREVLDAAATVDEAKVIFQKYNIDFGPGPDLHYLVADRNGNALLVELSGGQIVFYENDQPWYLATNFLVDQAGDHPERMCSRYKAIQEELEASVGALSTGDAMDLLSKVSQAGSYPTQWSVVYSLVDGQVHLVLGRQYDDVLTFSTDWQP